MCGARAGGVCVCTVQVEKQLKRRGESSTASGRTILFYYSSIILPYFSPFLSLSPPRIHSLSLSQWKLLLLGIHTTNARNLFFIDTVTRNRRTSFSENAAPQTRLTENYSPLINSTLKRSLTNSQPNTPHDRPAPLRYLF